MGGSFFLKDEKKNSHIHYTNHYNEIDKLPGFVELLSNVSLHFFFLSEKLNRSVVLHTISKFKYNASTLLVVKVED